MEQTRLSVPEAVAVHKNMGYRPYTGTLLRGHRFTLEKESALFPAALETIPQPPSVLYGIGNPEALKEGLAVVGARKMTPYGKLCATRFTRMAAQRGVPIISGGARGCDAVAHVAALEAGTTTVVILGGGCDHPYPASNVVLFQRVIDAGGAVVSEREWGFPPLPYTFRARNRLIAGLARATLIVEAGLPSGTFSTADEALAANKDVLVVPGAITSPTSAGANRLLYQGATPVVDEETFGDVLFNVFGCLKQEHIVGNDDVALSADTEDVSLEEWVRASLNANPLRIDDLLMAVHEAGYRDFSSSELMVCLTSLQIQGGIQRYPDGRFGPC